MHRTPVPTILILALLATASSGGTGWGVSPSVTLDTLDPEIAILAPPAGTVYGVEDSILFVWTVFDHNTAVSDEARRASGFVNGAPFESILFPEAVEQTWNWTNHMASSTECWLEIVAQDAFGNETTALGDTFAIYAPASPVPGLGLGTTLSPPSPNPFNPRTQISFDLEAAGQTSLTVFDLQGRRVKILCSGEYPAGHHETTWTGRDEGGRRMAGGSYLVRLSVAGRVVLTRKVVLIQ